MPLLPPFREPRALAASCEDYEHLAVITVHTRTRMYVLTRRLLCGAESECYIFRAYSPRLGIVRPGGSCSFNCAFPRTRKTREYNPIVTEGETPHYPREKVRDRRLRPARSSLNFPPNNAREPVSRSAHAYVSSAVHADSNPRPSC